MEPLSVYYSYNTTPNDAEIKGCCDIAAKFKHPILLFYACNEYENDTPVKHIFIHKDDSVDQVKLRISAGYKLL